MIAIGQKVKYQDKVYVVLDIDIDGSVKISIPDENNLCWPPWQWVDIKECKEVNK